MDILTQIAGNQGSGLSGILNQLFWAGLVIAVILAIVMIIRGGIEYMTIDAASNKESAKNRIKAAIGGLILCFSTILILNTINPGLTSFKLGFGSILNSNNSNGTQDIQDITPDTLDEDEQPILPPTDTSEKGLRDYLKQHNINVAHPACKPGEIPCNNSPHTTQFDPSYCKVNPKADVCTQNIIENGRICPAGTTRCITLEGTPEKAITGLVKLKKDSGADSIMVMGAMETTINNPRIPGEATLDIAGGNTKLDEYIKNNIEPGTSPVTSAKGTTYTHTNGVEFVTNIPDAPKSQWKVMYDETASGQNTSTTPTTPAPINADIKSADFFERFDQDFGGARRWVEYEKFDSIINNTPWDTVGFTNTSSVMELGNFNRVRTSTLVPANSVGMYVDFQKTTGQEGTTLFVRPFGIVGFQYIQIRVSDIKFNTPGVFISKVERISSNLFRPEGNPGQPLIKISPKGDSFTITYNENYKTKPSDFFAFTTDVRSFDKFKITFGTTAGTPSANADLATSTPTTTPPPVVQPPTPPVEKPSVLDSILNFFGGGDDDGTNGSSPSGPETQFPPPTPITDTSEQGLRDYLKQYNIVVAHPACTSGQLSCTNFISYTQQAMDLHGWTTANQCLAEGGPVCVTLEGINEATIIGLVNLKNRSGASKITIVGGIETDFNTTGISLNGSEKIMLRSRNEFFVDIRKGEDTKLDKYIIDKAVQTTSSWPNYKHHTAMELINHMGPAYVHSDGTDFRTREHMGDRPTRWKARFPQTTPVTPPVPGRSEQEIRDYLAQNNIVVAHRACGAGQLSCNNNIYAPGCISWRTGTTGEQCRAMHEQLNNTLSCQPGQTRCITLEGIGEKAIIGLVNLKNRSGASKITIVGGIETDFNRVGYRIEKIGNWTRYFPLSSSAGIIDLRQGEDTNLDTYISNQTLITHSVEGKIRGDKTNKVNFITDLPGTPWEQWKIIFY